MRSKNVLTALMLASALAVSAAPAVFAKSSEGEAAEMQALAGAKVTVVQAAEAVLAKVGGTVSSVQIIEKDGKPLFHVEVVQDGKQSDYTVDGQTGAVQQMTVQAEGEDDDDDDEE